jgi:hypothetical protein
MTRAREDLGRRKRAGSVARRNLTRALERFQKAGFVVVGLDMDGDVTLPRSISATTRSSSSSDPRQGRPPRAGDV